MDTKINIEALLYNEYRSILFPSVLSFDEGFLKICVHINQIRYIILEH